MIVAKRTRSVLSQGETTHAVRGHLGQLFVQLAVPSGEVRVLPYEVPVGLL